MFYAAFLIARKFDFKSIEMKVRTKNRIKNNG
jgi:hypothetical protein